MVNIKSGVAGVVLTVIVLIIEAVLLPIVIRQLRTLKDTTETANDNTTIDNTISILYVLPVGTAIAGLVASFAFAMK